MSNKFLDYNEDSLGLYMKEVRKSETITPEKEVELAIRIKEGDDRAIDELVKANLRFVIKIAKEYQNQGVPVADLINEGNYGLVTLLQQRNLITLKGLDLYHTQYGGLNNRSYNV
jgi:RNA polymerase primary sigma factor